MIVSQDSDVQSSSQTRHMHENLTRYRLCIWRHMVFDPIWQSLNHGMVSRLSMFYVDWSASRAHSYQ